MKEWWAAGELSGLPGLPSDRSNVWRRAIREGWLARGDGRSREYHLSSLPAETRAALIFRERKLAPPPTPAARPIGLTAERSAALWEAWDRKPGSIKDEAQRRFDAVAAVEKLIEQGERKLDAYACIAQELGESTTTIRNWIRLVKGAHPGDRLPLLAPKWTGRTAFAEYSDETYQAFRDLYLSPSKPSFAICYERVCKLAAAEGWTVPSLSTLKRDLERREDPAVVVLEREGERRVAELFPYLERDRTTFRALQALNVDGHNLDISTVWPDGEVCRATVIAYQDLYSNQYVGYRVAKAESAHEMGLAFLSVADRWGVCEHLYVDNTMAMSNKRMTAGASGRKRFRDAEGDPLGVLTILGVQVHFVQVRHGQSKPIERSFGELADRVSRHPAFEGAYLGNNPTNKPANYGQRTVPVADVVKVLDQEILAYNRRPNRSTEVCGGRLSFEQAFLKSYEAHSSEIRRLSPAQRRLLYLVAEARRVDKNGCVRLFGNRYWAAETLALRGKKVVVRYHPSDEGGLHRAVYIYALNGDFVCEAPVYDRAGFADVEAAERHNRARRQFVRTKKQHAVAARRLKAADVAAMIPAEPAPPPVAPQEIHVDFTVPSSPLEKIATILPIHDPDREEAQEAVLKRLGKLAGTLDEMIQEGRLTG